MNYIESKQTPDLIIHIDFKKSKKKNHNKKLLMQCLVNFFYQIQTTLILVHLIKNCIEVIVLFRILPLINQFYIYSLKLKTTSLTPQYNLQNWIRRSNDMQLFLKENNINDSHFFFTRKCFVFICYITNSVYQGYF